MGARRRRWAWLTELGDGRALGDGRWKMKDAEGQQRARSIRCLILKYGELYEAYAASGSLKAIDLGRRKLCGLELRVEFSLLPMVGVTVELDLEAAAD